MSVIHTPKKPSLDARVLFFPVICAFLLLVVFFRLWWLQVVAASEILEAASHTEHSRIPTLAPRGLIVDRSGNLVAGIRPQIVVTAIPYVLSKNPYVLPKLAEILETPVEQLRKKVSKAKNTRLPTPIFIGASIAAGSRIAESGEFLPGIGIETQPMRFYPDPIDYGHVLGNVWVPDEKDVERFSKKDVDPAKYVGKFGVEWFYEEALMGKPGSESMEMDNKRRPVRVVSSESDPATPGSRLVLSIDGNLQKLAAEKLQGRLGAVVAIEPSTGEVLAMVSSPGLNLKKFEGGISVDDYKALMEDEDKPYFNRAVKGNYAPGSTFKIVTSLAAYETHKLDPSRRIFCDGGYHFENGTVVKCEGHHGSIPYKTAFEKSCNTYFCTLGLDVGEEALQKAAHELGLGGQTGIDLRSDSDGVVPSRSWKEKTKRGKWMGGDTANMAIGQGFVLATPLQMADVAAIVANRGVLYQPHLVRGFRAYGSQSVDPVQPHIVRQIDVGQDFWDTLIDAMIGVVKEGTGGLARLPDMEWAGKTGSAEHGLKAAKKNTNAWFIGFAPADHPRIAIAVLLEEAGQGGDVAAPVARDIVKAYFDELRASASRASAANKSLPAAAALSASPESPKVR